MFLSCALPLSPLPQRFENDYLAQAARAVENLSKGWSAELSQSSPQTSVGFEARMRREEAVRSDAIQKALSTIQESAQRKSTPFFAMLVADLAGAGPGRRCESYHEVTVWRASGQDQSMFSEGKAFRVAKLCVSDKRDGTESTDAPRSVRLSSGRGTQWMPMNVSESVRGSTGWYPRRRFPLADLSSFQPGVVPNELTAFMDVCVVLLSVGDGDPVPRRRSEWSHVFVCDDSGALVVVEIRCPTQKLGSLCKLESVLAIRDLKCVCV